MPSIHEEVEAALATAENHFGSAFSVEVSYPGEYATSVILTSSYSSHVLYLIGEIRRRNAQITIVIEEDLDVGNSNSLSDFSNCRFKGSFTFRSSPRYELNFGSSIFEKRVNFNKVVFDFNVRFISCRFYQPVLFENTVFNKLVDFHRVIFHNGQQFLKTDFMDTAIFSNTWFRGPIQFLYTKVQQDSFINFEGAKFSMGLDISRSNFGNTANFWGTEFMRFKLNDFGGLLLYGLDLIQGGIITKGSTLATIKRLRESFRIIKHSFEIVGNHIEAGRFHRLEMSMYSEELNPHLLKRILVFLRVSTPIFARLTNTWVDRKFLNNWRIMFVSWPFENRFVEYVILKFNHYSNRHGQSWLQGVVFTTFTTLLSYTVYLACFDGPLEFVFQEKVIKQNVADFFQLLNLTNWEFKPFNLVQQWWSFPILFISRIFIGYGYYQTIQAFRMYGKR